jgi:hypothetical protein
MGDEELSPSEEKARKLLMELCKEIVDDYGEDFDE